MGSGSDDPVAVDRREVVALCRAALHAAGAGQRVAELLVDTALYAEDRGKAVVGVAHLLDHVDALDDGRLDGRAVPLIRRSTPAVTTCDARGGIAQASFDQAFPSLVRAARRYGLRPTLGVGRTPHAGSQHRSGSSATNPIAWSVPRPGRAPLTVDQASSSTAFVSVRDAAARGAPLPEGWAVDADGHPTTDAEAALAGALLPFGGYKGANIALLVELLSSMAGGNWSTDAPPWDSGSRPPSIGMFVLAVDHRAVGQEFPARAAHHLDRLAGSGVRLAGDRRTAAAANDVLTLRTDVLAALRRRAGTERDISIA